MKDELAQKVRVHNEQMSALEIVAFNSNSEEIFREIDRRFPEMIWQTLKDLIQNKHTQLLATDLYKPLPLVFQNSMPRTQNLLPRTTTTSTTTTTTTSSSVDLRNSINNTLPNRSHLTTQTPPSTPLRSQNSVTTSLPASNQQANSTVQIPNNPNINFRMTQQQFVSSLLRSNQSQQFSQTPSNQPNTRQDSSQVSTLSSQSNYQPTVFQLHPLPPNNQQHQTSSTRSSSQYTSRECNDPTHNHRRRSHHDDEPPTKHQKR